MINIQTLEEYRITTCTFLFCREFVVKMTTNFFVLMIFVDTMSTKLLSGPIVDRDIFLKNPGQTGPKPQTGMIWGGIPTSQVEMTC